MARKIVESGWRFKLAQCVLKLLYGRDMHYISPWKNAGVGANCIMTNARGEVLFLERAGKIEHVGCFDIPGGFLTLENNETFAEGIVREIREEIGLEIDPAEFPDEAIFATHISYERNFLEKENYTAISVYFTYPLSTDEIENIQTLDETANYLFLDKKVFEAYITKGLIPFPDTQKALNKFFKSEPVHYKNS